MKNEYNAPNKTMRENVLVIQLPLFKFCGFQPLGQRYAIDCLNNCSSSTIKVNSEIGAPVYCLFNSNAKAI